MTFEFRLSVEAEPDLADIGDYYNRIAHTVTDNFFKGFFDTLNFIKQNLNYFRKDTGMSNYSAI